MEIEDIYKDMTDKISDAQDIGVGIISHIEQMNIDLNNSEIPNEDTNKEKLENQISATYNILNLKNNIYTIQMLKFVQSLQKYITDKYKSIDIFLSKNSIKVKSTFANISETVGYLILPINIVDISEVS